MKKILMLLLVLLILVFIPGVKAQENKLNIEYHSGVYFVRTGGTVPDKTGKFPIFHLGDNIAYCIDPSKSVNTEDYVSSDGYVDLPYSNEVLEQLELYGYYGREYPGHDNIRYSMAAQALIWEKAGGQTVTYWTRPYGEGEEIDVSKEKNEILELVKKHRILPDLPTHVYGDVLHESIVIDKNNALDNFEIRDNFGEYEAYIENNKLHITPKEQGIFVINLQRKKYDDLNTIIFVGKDDSESQPLGLLRFSDLSKQEIVLSVDGVHIFLQKVDENNEPVKQMTIGFKIKKLSTGEYLCDFDDCSYWTDPVGSFVTNGLDFGEYEIEEIEDQIIPGYTWNSEKLIVNINEDNVRWDKDKLSYIDVSFRNNSVSASLELHKKGEKAIIKDNSISYQEINLENISFDLYDDANNFIKSIITDKNGYAKVDDLKVGKYYLLEKTNISEYIPNTDKINFEIKQDNTYQTHVNHVLTINNYLKKGKLEFSKVDDITNVGIPNTTIEIYNENNELLLTKTTDEKGKVIIDNLPLGKYFIKEKEANYYYQKSNEVIEFEINENNTVIKKQMTNQKIVGELEIIKVGEDFKVIDDEIKYEMKPLQDIEFNLYSDNGELINVLKTNENGVIIKELPLGKYYIEEKTKLEKYIDNKDKYYFEIKKSGDSGIPIKLNISNHLKKGGLELNKVDSVTKEGVSDTFIEIYDDNGLLINKKTDKEGKIILNDLPLGKYHIKEKEANYYYKKSDEIIDFEIKESDEIIKIEMTNQKIVGKVELYKKGEDYKFINNDIIFEKTELANVMFDLYDENNELIKTLKTDDDGYVKYDNLPIGKYYVIEKNIGGNYIKNDNKYYFEIKKDNNTIKLDINNYLKKGNLEFLKLDLVTNEGIPNTIIEVYSDSNVLLLTRETDEFGKVSIPNLPVGKYYIVEKEANSMYMLTNEKVYFEIKENGEVVNTKMTNEKITVPVPKTNTNEEVIAHSIVGVCLFIGLGGLFYERKKTA